MGRACVYADNKVITDLAKQWFGKNATQEQQNYVANLVGTWQTANKVYATPTIEQLKTFKKEISEKFSFEENDDLPLITTEQEYNKFLEEYNLSEEKTSSFIINFMTKILGVTPKNKVDYKSDSFVYTYAMRAEKMNYKNLEKLLFKIFGFKVETTENRDEQLKIIEEALSNWENKLLDMIHNPTDISQFYNTVNTIKQNIKDLTHELSEEMSFAEFDVDTGEVKTTKAPASVIAAERKRIGYKIQIQKRELKYAEELLLNAKYARAAKILAAKNRLTALHTIDNFKEVVKDRIVKEINSRSVSEEEYKTLILPKLEIANRIKNVLESNSNLSDTIPELYSEEQKEITYEKLESIVLKYYPEYSELLKLCRKANPKCKIIIGEQAQTFSVGTVTGWFKQNENVLHISNEGDIHTIIHEIIHSATYYGINGKEGEDGVQFKESINKFMDYIRDYIKKEQLNPELFQTSKFRNVTLPANIYGFTNADEFVAELFSNPAFRDLLETIPAMNQKKFNSILGEIWNSIINFINNITGRTLKKNALEQAERLGYAAMYLQKSHLDEIYAGLKKHSGTTLNMVVQQNSTNTSTTGIRQEIVKAITNVKKSHEDKGVVNSIPELYSEEQKEITYEKLESVVLKYHPEYSNLLKLCHKVNPKCKIIIGAQVIKKSTDSSIVGFFDNHKNELNLTNKIDIKEIVHEIVHAATFYGINSNPEAEGTIEFEKSINTFMDYIRDYIKKEQLDPALFQTSKVNGAIKDAPIYGFTSADEFVAELFSNPAFRDLLETIPAMNQKKFNSLLSEIWNSIINFINNITGRTLEKNALEQAEKLGYAAMGLQKSYLTYSHAELKAFLDAEWNKGTQPNSTDTSTTSAQQEKVMTASEKLNEAFTPQELNARAHNVSLLFNDALVDLIYDARDTLEEDISKTKDPIERAVLQFKLSKLAEEEDYTQNALTYNLISIEQVKDKIRETLEQKLDYYQKQPSGNFNDHAVDQYTKMLDCFEELFNRATVEIQKEYGIRIVGSKTSQKAVEQTEEEEDRESTENGNTGWGYKIRLINPHSTLSKTVKNILGSIIKVQNGKMEVDDLGYAVRLSEGYVYSILLTNLANMTSSEDFHTTELGPDGNLIHHLPALERLEKRYYWVRNIINILQDDPDLIPMFYSAMRQDAIKYCSVDERMMFDANSLAHSDSMLEAIRATLDGNQKLSDDSIYDGSTIFLKKVEKAFDIITTLSNKAITENEGFGTEKDYENLQNVLKAIGVETFSIKGVLDVEAGSTSDAEKANISKVLGSISFILDGLIKKGDASKKNKSEKISSIEVLNLFDEYKSKYQQIAEVLGESNEYSKSMTFRQGKDRDAVDFPTYSAPNYSSTLLTKLVKASPEVRAAIVNRYKKDLRFYFNGKWRLPWMEVFDETIENEENKAIRENLYNSQTYLFNVNYLQGKPYEDWTKKDIFTNFVTIYFSAPNTKDKTIQYANYNMPIFSDSPNVSFIRQRKYIGTREEIRKQIIPKLVDLVYIELTRNRIIAKRNAEGIDLIANFDHSGNGRFYWFPQMNTDQAFLDELNKLIDDVVSAQSDKNRITANASLKEHITKYVEQQLEEEFNNFLNNEDLSIDDIRNHLASAGITYSTAAKNTIDRKKNGEQLDNIDELMLKNLPAVQYENVEDALYEYFANTFFATSQIIQMTTIDPAYYKFDGGIDFQKRYKEVYAAGRKLDTNSKYGRKKERTVYLRDQIQASTILNNIKKIFDTAVANKLITKEQAESIIKQYSEINVADAQAFRSLSSYRAVKDMLGEWSTKHEEAYNRIINGEYNSEDLDVMFSTIKPFMFSIIEQQATSNPKDGTILVPHQNKNSEFTLLAMYDMFSQATGTSSALRGINRFMEDYDIDLVQYESAVKTGAQGIVDISINLKAVKDYLANDKFGKTLNLNVDDENLGDKFRQALVDALLKGEIVYKNLNGQAAFNAIMESVEPTEEDVYNTLVNSCVEKSQDGSWKYKPTVVHELDYEDYMIAQPTPDHMRDQDVVFGSQFRNLIVSDMPEFLEDGKTPFTVLINGKAYTKQEVLTMYDSANVANLVDSFIETYKEVSDIEKIGDFLQRQIQDNPKYSRSFAEAVAITRDANGNRQFTLPLDIPQISKSIQDLLLSKFKNGVTKQKINGASCILVAPVGKTKELKIVLEDGTKLTGKETDEELALLKKHNAIRGAECYLPASSKQMFKAFLVTKKTKDGKEYQVLDINKVPDELKHMVGYRIPTEGKSSMLPLIIKGFMPEQNGGTIMVPADITVIAGSDYDVDKMFLMIPSFKVIKYDYAKAKKDFEKINNDEAVNKLLASVGLDTDIETTPEEFREWFKEHKEEYKLKQPKLKKIKFDHNKSFLENSVEARNNLIIDIATGILTNKDTMTQLFNPVNFDPIKKEAKIAAIMSDPEIFNSWAEENEISKEDIFNELKKLSIKQLNAIIGKYSTPRSFLNPTTFAYFHGQNATGNKLIGGYANTNTMQGKYQTTQLALKPECAFFINGCRIESLHNIFTVRNGVKQYISKICDYFVSASVDNVKDPVLALIQQSPQTRHIVDFMARAGMTVEEISLMFSQPLVKERLKAKEESGERADEGTMGVFEETLEDIMKIFGLDPREKDSANKYYDIKKAISDKISEYLNYEDDKGNKVGITSNLMAENIIDGNIKDSNYLEDIQDPVIINGLIELIAKQMAVFRIWLDIEDYATALNRTVSFSRADSRNAAVDITFAGANIQTYKVAKYLDDAKKGNTPFVWDHNLVVPGVSYGETTDKEKLFSDLMSEKIPMKRLQAMYTLGIEKATQAYSNYFISQQLDAQKLAQRLYLSNPKIRKNQLNDLYLGMTLYSLSKTKLFGQESTDTTYKTKRDYYLYEFPTKLIELIKENIKEIDKYNNDPKNIKKKVANPILRHLSIKNGTIQLERSGRISPELRETFEYLFENLWYGTNIEKQLAKDLFMYSYYKEGFNFGPNSFGIFFNTNYFLHFPEIIQTLRTTYLSPADTELIEQLYMLQHPELVHNFMGKTRVAANNIETNVFSGKFVYHRQDEKDKTDEVPTGWYRLEETIPGRMTIYRYRSVNPIFNNRVAVWDVNSWDTNGNGSYSDEKKEKEKYDKISKITTYSLNKLNERASTTAKSTTSKDKNTTSTVAEQAAEQVESSKSLPEDLLGQLDGYDAGEHSVDEDSAKSAIESATSFENSGMSDEDYNKLMAFIDKQGIEKNHTVPEDILKYDENKSQQIQIDNGGKPLCK